MLCRARLRHWGGGGKCALESTDSVKIHFRQSKINFDPDYLGNQQAIDSFVARITRAIDNPANKFVGVTVTGAASPEGSIQFNQWLSEQRAEALFSYLSRRIEMPREKMNFRFLGRDWQGLAELLATDPNVPDRAEVIALVNKIIADQKAGVTPATDPLLSLKAVGGGYPYLYIYYRHFPKLRASGLSINYNFIPADSPRVVREPMAVARPVLPSPEVSPLGSIRLPAIPVSPELPPFYMAVKTNMLYDALLVPNIGVEMYLGGLWSAAAQWKYSWMKNDHSHHYWRIYGGDLEVRRWFGAKALEKPLQGHHVGVYGGITTYDFELGGKGYLAPKWTWYAGVSYGYSMPLSRRLNLDFTLGIGYISGMYKEYIPVDNCYVWQATKHQRRIFPTKVEVSLVWLIGRGNYNKQKGGRL